MAKIDSKVFEPKITIKNTLAYHYLDEKIYLAFDNSIQIIMEVFNNSHHPRVSYHSPWAEMAEAIAEGVLSTIKTSYVFGSAPFTFDTLLAAFDEIDSTISSFGK